GISSAAFVRCAGLGARIEIVEYLEGGHGPRRFPGDIAYGNIVLERAVSADHELEDWFQKGDRREGGIVLLSPSGKEARRWAVSRGWRSRGGATPPSPLRGPEGSPAAGRSRADGRAGGKVPCSMRARARPPSSSSRSR